MRQGLSILVRLASLLWQSPVSVSSWNYKQVTKCSQLLPTLEGSKLWSPHLCASTFQAESLPPGPRLLKFLFLSLLSSVTGQALSTSRRTCLPHPEILPAQVCSSGSASRMGLPIPRKTQTRESCWAALKLPRAACLCLTPLVPAPAFCLPGSLFSVLAVCFGKGTQGPREATQCSNH